MSFGVIQSVDCAAIPQGNTNALTVRVNSNSAVFDPVLVSVSVSVLFLLLGAAFLAGYMTAWSPKISQVWRGIRTMITGFPAERRDVGCQPMATYIRAGLGRATGRFLAEPAFREGGCVITEQC
jgi:hypothetical protein